MGSRIILDHLASDRAPLLANLLELYIHDMSAIFRLIDDGYVL